MIQKTTYRIETTNESSSLTPEPSPYLLLFHDDKPPVSSNNHQCVVANSIDETSMLLCLLGQLCKPVFSRQYCQEHPLVCNQVMNIASTQQQTPTPLDVDTAAGLLKKLPLDLKNLIGSPIALTPKDPAPPLIRQELVHKKNEANILISESVSIGNLHYFNMFEKTAELRFDHHSEHVQGMLIIEGMRQAGIATAHLHGLPEDGKLALLMYNTGFSHFVERNTPIVLRSYSNFSADENSEDKAYEVCIQVLQWGKVCAETVIKTFACMSEERQKKLDERLKRIALRQKKQFKQKVDSILETKSENQCE